MPVNRLLISGAVLVVVAAAMAGLKLALPEEPIRQPYHFESAKASYSFFVAGHTYGSPGDDNVGFYPPFKSGLNSIDASRKMKFGILTGDVVISGSDKNWNEIDDDIRTLKIPVHIAVGNHDLSDRDLYLKRYGKTYRSFEHGSDLFIILDPSIDKWSIKGGQLQFLKRVLGKPSAYKNIFVFLHQVIWWEPDNKFSGIKINSTSGRVGPTNFWPEIEPLLRAAKTNVFVFAGDVGAFRNHLPSYFKFENIHLIASGMGGGENDNFLVVTVNSNASVAIDLIWLDPTSAFARSKAFLRESLALLGGLVKLNRTKSISEFTPPPR